MFDYSSKIAALVNNYGLEILLEQNEISEEKVIQLLVDEGLIDFEEYFFLDDEYAAWEELEQ